MDTYIHTYIHTCMYTLHYITLQYNTLHYITLHYNTIHYITLHYIHYITLHYITLHTYIHTHTRIIYIYKYIYLYPLIIKRNSGKWPACKWLTCDVKMGIFHWVSNVPGPVPSVLPTSLRPFWPCGIQTLPRSFGPGSVLASAPPVVCNVVNPMMNLQSGIVSILLPIASSTTI